MTAPGAPLEREALDLPQPAAGEVLIAIAGCGICHTDLGFLYGGVRTNHELPLALGHEISGTVVASGGADTDAWLHRPVVVPAVLPCGECDLCMSGHETACRQQRMPGNDFHGGFASHVVVPARWLVDASGLPESLQLADLAVLADAITTPYQAIERAQLTAGDSLILIGAGGIGAFGVQIAVARGARVVVVDIDDIKLQRAQAFGACATVNTVGLDAKEARRAVQAACREAGLADIGCKVLEMSGTAAGQALAWSLMSFNSTVGIVGFCLDRVPVRLSNLMAFDASAFGNWGCRPQLYAPALDLVRQGKVQVTPLVRHFSMDDINHVLEEVRAHRIPERPVLIP